VRVPERVLGQVAARVQKGQEQSLEVLVLVVVVRPALFREAVQVSILSRTQA
jgi:hypothetical protein